MKAPDTSNASGSSRFERRAEAGPLLLLAAAFLVLAALYLNGRLADWGGDNVHYLLLAESLASGTGYANLHLPGAPFHAHYPPLFPLLLAPFVGAGASLVVIKAWAALLSFAGPVAAYLFLRPVCGRGIALLCALGTIGSATWLDVSLSGMSDGPFMLFAFAALGALRRAFEGPGVRRGAAVLAGLLAGAAILTRTVGLVLLPAAALYVLLDGAGRRGAGRRGAPENAPEGGAGDVAEDRAPEQPAPGGRDSAPAGGASAQPAAGRRDRARALLAFALAAGVVAGPWFVAVVAQRGPARIAYLREFTGSGSRPVAPRADLLDRPGVNAGDFGARIAETPLPPALRALGPPWDEAARAAALLLFAVAAGITLLGFARALVRRRGVEDAYVACYAAVLAFWLPSGFRLLLPLFPILLLYLHDGASALAARLPGLRRAPGRAGAAALALALAANLVVIGTFPQVERRLAGRYDRWWNDYLRTVCTVGALARPGDTIVARPPNVPFYLAGVQAAPFRARTKEGLLDALDRSRARFVVLTPGLCTVLGPEFVERVRGTPGRYALVARSGGVEAWEVLPKGAPDGAAAPGRAPDASAGALSPAPPPPPAPIDPARWSPRCRAIVPAPESSEPPRAGGAARPE